MRRASNSSPHFSNPPLVLSSRSQKSVIVPFSGDPVQTGRLAGVRCVVPAGEACELVND
ncbi:MAG: hypothetical protein A4E40_00138 [Methanoregulaceae archaeon PtaU1.Bin059]|nr:MAG: hypothetical protein A4E39_01142 [Methanoregulaceae archaeon PtaB.Bin152]OPY43475.1 MAG: hypothetical protein A4E40_00138 [Methanoregulaceae archaeon PtaU1.Bin059]